MSKRKFPNWLKGLMTYVEETESPRNFWMWSGLFTLASALQRKVWLPYGLDNVYPNLYILIVAPPAICRKGAPVSLSKRMLSGTGLKVSVDSSSKRALTKELEEISKEQIFNHKGIPFVQSAMAIISKEMSSLLAVDPKGIIEILTDLFDSHDKWEYKTSGSGADFIEGVCVSALIATTPSWLSANLPYEAIGGGFSSRFAIITGQNKYKEVPIPPIPDVRIYEALMSDLAKISLIKGEFSWGKNAKQYFVEWYKTLKDKLPEIKDDRLHPFIGRIHVIAIKVAMALRVAYSSTLILSLGDITTAVNLVEEVLATASASLGGVGLSRFGPTMEKIKLQLAQFRKISEKDLLLWNYRDLEGGDFDLIMGMLCKMNVCKVVIEESKVITYYVFNKGE